MSDGTIDPDAPREGPGKKAKAPRKILLQKINNNGPCPNNSCVHPPIDHRPVAGSKNHFCYGKGCMCTCVPKPVFVSKMPKLGTYRGATA